MPIDAPVPPPTPGRLPRRVRLWAEFAALFLGVPLWMAALERADLLWGILATMSVTGIVLYAVTPGVRWHALLEGGLIHHWHCIALFAATTVAIVGSLVLWLAPDRLFDLPRNMPGLWIRIMLLYPFLSALPQELVFRALFFERYGSLFPNRIAAVAINTAVFSLAHAFYANWIAVGLTFAGGFVFAWAYAYRRSFPLALVLHALGGQIVFTLGLGIYFYHGAVGTL